jgi:hypothetical protein
MGEILGEKEVGTIRFEVNPLNALVPTELVNMLVAPCGEFVLGIVAKGWSGLSVICSGGEIP